MSTAIEKLAYSITELVRISGVGRSFIYEEISAGRLKVKKAGRRTLILHAEATKWLGAMPDMSSCANEAAGRV